MLAKNMIHVIARAVIIQEDRILMCHTQDMNPNYYFLPGGHVEVGESAEVAVLRELREEGGITGNIKKFLGCFEHSFDPNWGKCHFHEYNLYFEVMIGSFDPDQEIPQLESHIKLVWIPLTKLNALDFRPEPLKAILPRWLSQDLGEAFVSHMGHVKKL
jgi:8-oxo-dGTP pyrophosphatase MutT (NUDIX family)